MSGTYPLTARTLWTLAGSGLSTTLTATGNSQVNSSVIDLTNVCDVWLSVYCTAAATGTSPTLAVNLDVQDAAGNWIVGVFGTSGIAVGTPPGGKAASIGLHIGPAGSMGPLVLPQAGRVTWTIGGTASPTFPGTAISLIGR